MKQIARSVARPYRAIPLFGEDAGHRWIDLADAYDSDLTPESVLTLHVWFWHTTGERQRGPFARTSENSVFPEIESRCDFRESDFGRVTTSATNFREYGAGRR